MSIKSLALKAAFAGAILLGGTAASLAAPAYATTSVNVRGGPGTNYRVVDQLYRGESVDVLGCRSGWCRIEHPGADGWVSASYLARDGYRRRDRYDDYYEPDFSIRPPARYPHRYRNWRRAPQSSACFGGPNASFCFYD